MLGFNGIDIFIVVFLLLWAVHGYRRGFIIVTLDLLTFLGSFFLALAAYPWLSLHVNHSLGLSRGFANLFSFLGFFAVFHFLLGLLELRLYPRIRTWLKRWHLGNSDRVMGIVASSIGGFIWLSLLLGVLSWFPLSMYVKQGIAHSRMGAAIVERASVIEPGVEQIAGRAIDDTIAFLAPHESKKDKKWRPNIPPRAGNAVDSSAEAYMLALVNEERKRLRLRPLKSDSRLQDIARAHSLDMVKYNYFNHMSPTTGSPSDRLLTAGIFYLSMGENIAYSQDIGLAHNSLMKSPGHRAHILSPVFRKAGIGIVNSEPYGFMCTQDFTN